MFEYPEVISLILCTSLFVFLLSLTKQYKFKLPVSWVACISFLVLSEVFTVLEGVFWYRLLNILEHLSFTLASITFFIGIFKYRDSDG